MFDLFLFDEQILMPGIISKFLIHLEIRIKLITDTEMLLFLFSPFFKVKATGNCTKNTVHTVYISVWLFETLCIILLTYKLFPIWEN